MSAPKWTVPAWMEQFIPLIHNTGGNPVPEMMNGRATPDVNLPLAVLQACVKSQVGLLVTLRERGFLDPSAKDIRELCGHVEDGSHSVVKIFQDDATQNWCVQVERRSYYGNSFAEAVTNAKGEG